MPLIGEGTGLQQDPTLLQRDLSRLDLQPSQQQSWRHRGVGAVGGALLLTTIVLSGCGEGEEHAPGQGGDGVATAAPNEGESAAIAPEDSTTTTELLDALAVDSPLDHLDPYTDRLADQDASVLANTFLARLDHFSRTGDPGDLKLFSIVAKERASSIEEHENPERVTPSPDATWAPYWSTLDESMVIALVSGSVDVDHGESDQIYAGETVRYEGVLVVVGWNPDGSMFGRFAFEMERDTVLEDLVLLDQAPPGALDNQIAESTTTAPPETTTTEPEPEMPDTTEAPEIPQVEYPPELDAGPPPNLDDMRPDNTGFFWKWNGQTWVPFGGGA